jgi:hypothetical protein
MSGKCPARKGIGFAGLIVEISLLCFYWHITAGDHFHHCVGGLWGLGAGKGVDCTAKSQFQLLGNSFNGKRFSICILSRLFSLYQAIIMAVADRLRSRTWYFTFDLKASDNGAASQLQALSRYRQFELLE